MTQEELERRAAEIIAMFLAQRARDHASYAPNAVLTYGEVARYLVFVNAGLSGTQAHFAAPDLGTLCQLARGLIHRTDSIVAIHDLESDDYTKPCRIRFTVLARATSDDDDDESELTP